MINVDEFHSGLLCRVVGCRRVFNPMVRNNLDMLLLAGKARDAHETRDHQYTHVIPELSPVWGFGAKMTHRGRSKLGEKGRP